MTHDRIARQRDLYRILRGGLTAQEEANFAAALDTWWRRLTDKEREARS